MNMTNYSNLPNNRAGLNKHVWEYFSIYLAEKNVQVEIFCIYLGEKEKCRLNFLAFIYIKKRAGWKSLKNKSDLRNYLEYRFHNSSS